MTLLKCAYYAPHYTDQEIESLPSEQLEMIVDHVSVDPDSICSVESCYIYRNYGVNSRIVLKYNEVYYCTRTVKDIHKIINDTKEWPILRLEN